SIDGQPAGSTPGPTVTAGKQFAVAVPVRNSGTTTLSQVAATMPGGGLACSATTLSPGAATTCQTSAMAGTGTGSVSISVTAVDPNGDPVSARATAHFVGAAATGQPGVGGTQSGSSNVAVGLPQTATRPITGLTPGQVTKIPGGAPNTGGGPVGRGGVNRLLIGGLLLIAAGVIAALRRATGRA
ncbi:MAG TPA: hypothetical protein VHF26_14650, partial [Trebonia sp.]|nr:hypothetical protein [Trebonia sp.]